MEILLIYENVPDETLVFLIPNAPDWVEKAHNIYINASDCPEEGERYDAAMRLSDAVSSKPEYCNNPNDEWACAFRKHLVTAKKPIVTKGPVKVVRCGFLG